MAYLFSPGSNRVARAALLAAGLCLVLVPLGVMVWVRTPAVTGEGAAPSQPVAFDHRIHVAGLRIDCRYCHSTAESAPTAGLPPTETCIPCHSTLWREGPLFAPVRSSLGTNRPIPWLRVNALPDFVFFNHAVHLKGGIGCEACHGRVDRMARVRQVAPLTMSWCLDCHRNPEPYRRPANAVVAMGWHSVAGSVGPKPLPDDRITAITTCSACHR
jgi:hypothetical protein